MIVDDHGRIIHLLLSCGNVFVCKLVTHKLLNNGRFADSRRSQDGNFHLNKCAGKGKMM